MYPSRGNNAYGQQQQQQQQTYSGQSAYGQNLGPDGGASQMSMSSRHSAMLSGHPSAGTHYGGLYASVYGGSMALSSALEASSANARESGAPGDYSVRSQKYGQKELSEYSPGDRRQYVDRAGVYSARDLQHEPYEPTAVFGDSVAFGHHQHQGDIYSHLDAASSLRKELLQAQTLQSASVEGSSRQADYLSRPATISGRIDDLSHRVQQQQHAPSILGAGPQRDKNDLMYAPNSATSGYGVSLPPGRDYGAGKGLHSTPQGAILARGGYTTRVDNRKDDRTQVHTRELDRKAEELRREVLREREKERERKRERERTLERRDRENKRVTEKKRERTPPRIESSSHRRRSPAKEKRRDYVCKVNSSSLLDVERDYLSIEKRYPRLFTSPECSKVIVNWSRENLKIPLNVPVSFEHNIIKDDTETQQKEASITPIADDPVKSEHGNTLWNAKILLMSGLSQNALEELSSERDYEDRIPHFCNMIRFACLKNGNTLKAIGGLWETVDGNDPSLDKSTLIHTALRYAKDLTGLDLKNCQHWNSFLEIHYDRVGKDGVFSHKEVTVLYIPDLTDCLPSVDAWRDQWLAHKKAIAEREHQHALKKEISRGKKEGLKDKEPETPKDLKKDAKLEKNKASGSDESASKLKESAKDKPKEPEKEGVQINAEIEKKSGVETPGEGKTGSGKKKIIRKVIKKKAIKKDKAGNTAKQSDSLDSKKVGGATTQTEVAGQSQIQGQGQGQGQGQESTGNTPVVKTYTKKKVIKKVPVKKAVKKEDEGTQCDVPPVKEQDSSENKPKDAETGSENVKKTVKKKVIKRVVKRKVVAKEANKDKVVNKPEVTIEDQSEQKDESEKEEKQGKTESDSSSKMKGIGVQSENNEKSKSGEKLKEVKMKKEKDGKGETKGKEVKDNKKEEEVPRHPGLIFQTKESNKFHSSSLSLDSLLDYDDNDIEESTFEFSVFAETFYEMLQYQMGSRLLSFLQKLRVKFVAKRNQKKRQLEEISEKEKVKTNNKRLKTDDSEVQTNSVENKTLEEDEKNIPKVENMVTENIENKNTKSDEDLEEDEDMTDASSKDDTVNVKSKNIVRNEEEEKVDIKKKENIDKELLQAFRFFDRNRVGFIRVEDMRLIIHNLGNFLSHREVKELVQSALLESNTGRDDRILYNKLVRVSNI